MNFQIFYLALLIFGYSLTSFSLIFLVVHIVGDDNPVATPKIVERLEIRFR